MRHLSSPHSSKNTKFRSNIFYFFEIRVSCDELFDVTCHLISSEKFDRLAIHSFIFNADTYDESSFNTHPRASGHYHRSLKLASHEDTFTLKIGGKFVELRPFRS